MQEQLPVVLKSDLISSNIEQGKAALESGKLHLLKCQVLCDRTEALYKAGKTSQVSSDGRLIEVFERRIEPDGARTERYTRIQEGGNNG